MRFQRLSLDVLRTAVWGRTAALFPWLRHHGGMLSVIGSIVAFAVSTLLMWYSFDETLKTTKAIEQVTLSRELSKEYAESATFAEIHATIAACKPLYDGNGGKFTWQQINRFLGFFEDVGFYYRRGALDYASVDHLFGGIILETYVYAEIQDYIANVRENSAEPSAFTEFMAIGERLAVDPLRSAQRERWERDCRIPGKIATPPKSKQL